MSSPTRERWLKLWRAGCFWRRGMEIHTGKGLSEEASRQLAVTKRLRMLDRMRDRTVSVTTNRNSRALLLPICVAQLIFLISMLSIHFANAQVMEKAGEQPVRIPIIDLREESPMMVGERRLVIYSDGSITGNFYGYNQTNMDPAALSKMLNDLEKKGFFALDNSRIKDSIWRIQQGIGGPHILTQDSQTDTLTVNYKGKTNTVSALYSPLYMKYYPQFKEYQVFQDCLTIVATNTWLHKQ